MSHGVRTGGREVALVQDHGNEVAFFETCGRRNDHGSNVANNSIQAQ
jgi:hypothetical protein